MFNALCARPFSITIVQNQHPKDMIIGDAIYGFYRHNLGSIFLKKKWTPNFELSSKQVEAIVNRSCQFVDDVVDLSAL
jgi:hypothetical protein